MEGSTSGTYQDLPVYFYYNETLIFIKQFLLGNNMPNGSATIVQKLWNYCNVLRDDGMSYGDYVEQLICPMTKVQQ
jgi:hypothetical protein